MDGRLSVTHVCVPRLRVLISIGSRRVDGLIIGFETIKTRIMIFSREDPDVVDGGNEWGLIR